MVVTILRGNRKGTTTSLIIRQLNGLNLIPSTSLITALLSENIFIAKEQLCKYKWNTNNMYNWDYAFSFIGCVTVQPYVRPNTKVEPVRETSISDEVPAHKTKRYNSHCKTKHYENEINIH